MNNNLKKKATALCAATVFSLALLTACGNSRVAEQEDLKAKGIASMQAGDYSAAAASFKEALSKSRYSVGDEEIDLTFYLATADYLAGDKADAIASLDALTDLETNNANACFLRGSMYLLEGENEKAISDYDAAIAADPTDYDCYIAIYENLAARGQTDKANEYLNKALGAGKDSAKDFLNRGRIYELQGQRAAAESAYKSAADKGEGIAALYSALLTAEDGNTEDAVNDVSAYMKEKKKLTPGENLLIAQIYGADGQYDAAASAVQAGLNDAGASEDEKQDLLRETIVLYEKQLDFNAAYAAANDYIAAYPGDAAVARELTFLSTRKK